LVASLIEIESQRSTKPAKAALLLPELAMIDGDEKVNILLVDDQPTKLLAHGTVLEELGETIVRARSGREALEALLRYEFAVILLDVNMPEMDGFETAAMIRERPSLERTPIIFVTGYNTSDIDRLKGYGFGAADYLFLPIIPDVLKTKVKVFIDLARQNRLIKKQTEYLTQQNLQQQEQIRTIQELNRRLREAIEDLESFSYSVSHDLRGPLRAMQGYSHLLLTEWNGKLDVEALDYLLRINKSAARMDTLIQDVLAYSRVSKLDIRTEPINLEELLTDILQEKQNLRDIRLLVRSPLHAVVAHKACLSQCLSNLLDNAAKFVPEGRKPEITVRTEPCESFVRIWVEDNGIGIDPAFRPRLFRMFERAHNGQNYDGTGIGLSIVKKATERMGGTVGVESAVGVGSKFWIELPRATIAPPQTVAT
jgi:two-component system, sensor histidine kinase and response regulator